MIAALGSVYPSLALMLNVLFLVVRFTPVVKLVELIKSQYDFIFVLSFKPSE